MFRLKIIGLSLTKWKTLEHHISDSPFDVVVATVVVAAVAVAVAVWVAKHCNALVTETCGGGKETLYAVTRRT